MNVDRFKYHSYVLNNIRFFPCAIPLSRTHNEKNERTLCSKNTFFFCGNLDEEISKHRDKYKKQA